MKIFSAAQLKKWDAFTIAHEPVAPVDLMERAASACVNWILQYYNPANIFFIFCSKGNNGGDGLAIARMLLQNGFTIQVYIVGSDKKGSPEFETNLERFRHISPQFYFLKSKKDFPVIEKNTIIVDAIFGTGLNKKPAGITSELIEYINKSSAEVISVDVPSGMYVDKSSSVNPIVRSRYTLTFQQSKLAFLITENEKFFGDVIVLNIQLAEKFYNDEAAAFELTDEKNIEEIYVPRDAFANKGNFGHACLLAGSYGMMGAAVLSARSCLRSGVGKLTCYVCKQGYAIMQTSVPEAMCLTSGNTFINNVQNLKDFDVIGVGPGIGRHVSHKQLLQKIFKNAKGPVVMDADALNVLSCYSSLYNNIPAASIITPHPKEFDRLFGESKNDFDRMHLALQKAKEYNIHIVLKGHHTLIAAPDGKGYFNSTGNAGMATAGAGDVLTGIITSLLAQKYKPLHACILGVYLHGLAGDIAADKLSQEAMIAGDIIDHLGEAFLTISNN